ncbi:CopG family transcriptional regulator [bacterium]|nr:CopG family transcriptional regulator [bacterium]
MDRQNVTVSFSKSLLKKAKILAASMDKSLSELFRETIEQRVKEAEGYNTSKNRQLALLKQGLNLGTKGRIKITREELYDR